MRLVLRFPLFYLPLSRRTPKCDQQIEPYGPDFRSLDAQLIHDRQFLHSYFRKGLARLERRDALVHEVERLGLEPELLLRRPVAGRRERRRDNELERHARHELAVRRVDLLVVDSQPRHLAGRLTVHGDANYRVRSYGPFEQRAGWRAGVAAGVLSAHCAHHAQQVANQLKHSAWEASLRYALVGEHRRRAVGVAHRQRHARPHVFPGQFAAAEVEDHERRRHVDRVAQLRVDGVNRFCWGHLKFLLAHLLEHVESHQLTVCRVVRLLGVGGSHDRSPQ
mmetsp:Transcript_23301/g.60731  ORF Transcript_23301/g.60731 Transcript_23301/m.60731 type:complete len:279 (-) Transcript_23301:1543-2379(-)